MWKSGPMSLSQYSGDSLDVLRRYLLITLLLTAIAAVSSAPVSYTTAATTTTTTTNDNAEILALDFLPVTKDRSGVFDVLLGSKDGPNQQQVSMLVSIYTNSDAMMEVPAASLCSTEATGSWNAIAQPKQGDQIVVEDANSNKVTVKWETTASSQGDMVVGLTLRKGRGNEAKNVTIIESTMANDGEYSWNASATFRDKKLKDGVDYSLMIWSETPPRKSISGYFTLRSKSGSGDSTISAALTAELERQKACLEYLANDGGYYNQSLDSEYVEDGFHIESYKNAMTGWELGNTAMGSTTLSFQGQDKSAIESQRGFKRATMDLISSTTLGRGMFSLSRLQVARNASFVEMNIIALNLGTKGHPGSAVLGGYDDALIDKSQRAVFAKGSSIPDAFHATMTKLSVVDGGSEMAVLSGQTNSESAVDVILTYDDFGIRLSQNLINSLLGHVGNPKWDATFGGYVYEKMPDTDFSLKFSLTNGTDEVVIKVPGTSLVVTESSDDNPLTAHDETGKIYLRIKPTPDGSAAGQFLGRSFLQHVYMIDSPSTIGKFHLSALPSSLPSKKRLIAASPSSNEIFGGQFTVENKTSSLGPIVGGIIGGLAFVVAVVFGFFWFFRRQKIQRSGSHAGHRSINIIDRSSFDKEAGLGHIAYHHRGGDSGGGGASNMNSIRTTATIPISYSPSYFEKDVAIGYRYSPSQGVQSQPVMLFSTPSISNRSGTSGDGREQDLEIRDSRLSVTLSAIQRRNSEVSTVAREYNTGSSSEPDETHEPVVPDEPVPQLYRSATVARMYTAGKVKSLTPPQTPGSPIKHSSRSSGNRSPVSPGGVGSAGGHGHTRTASLGRVVTPTEVDVPGGRRSSSRASGDGGSGEARGGSSGSGRSARSGSLEGLLEEYLPVPVPPPPVHKHPQPQSAILIDNDDEESDPETQHRRLTTQTRSSTALVSPRDTLDLPQPLYAASSSHSDSRASTILIPESVSERDVNYLRLGLDSLSNSRSESSGNDGGTRSSEEGVFGLGAVRGEYLVPAEGWLASSSEGERSSGEKEVRQEQFLSSRAGSKASRRSGR